MITADPARRQLVLEEIRTHLAREAAPEDRDLLLSFAPVVYAEMPDAMALALPPPAVAARILGYFHFVAHTIPPSHQLYRGLPGIHVVVRDPEEAETEATGSTHGGHYEITIVETHTQDAPFIFESLRNYLQNQGLHILSAVHPIFTVRRQWERIVWLGGPHEDASKELLCQFRIERVESRERQRRMEHQIHALLKSVFLAVEDFDAMRRLVRSITSRLRPRHEGHDVTAGREFIEWLLDDNYVQLGVLQFAATPEGIEPVAESALGAFRDPALLPVVYPGMMESEQRHIAVRPDDTRVIDIDFRNNAEAIHQNGPMDDIVIREWGAGGELAGATLLLGRLAKGAFTAKAETIPLLKQKLAWALEQTGVLVNSHTYRELRALFNHFPKRELFYADAQSLKDLLERMVYISSDDEIVVTVREGDGYTALAIAFPDMHYSNKAEQNLCDDLESAFGPVAFHTWADCGTVALLLFYFNHETLERPLDATRVRQITANVISTWEDQVAHALERALGARDGRRLLKRYVRHESRSGLYRELTRPEEVPGDLTLLESLESRLELRLLTGSAETATLKIFSPREMGLTDTLRTLQHLGLSVREEVNIPLTLPEGRRAWLERLKVEASPAAIAAVHADPDRLRDALRALQEGAATDDALNALVVGEGLAWRDVEVLRTLRNHLLQLRPNYTAETVTGVLLRNPQVASALFRAFEAKFAPAIADRAPAMSHADDALRAAFRSVGSLLDDEILRGLENLVSAAIRTNFYQRPQRPVLSIKVECAKVESMVSPRPLFEIYVHSRLLEGIHLRGGKVARGGIRWSDRHDDFRTEILGLMKTQMLKNSIIVPVGSKGGFVLKGNVPPRPALDAYLVDRYREFVAGLLDVTDNLVNGELVHPPEVVRHDEPDPYLVVAADKGTAHLSDTANRVSAQYGFWLGDAFASGGSNGYDHKREGITARGAWECVKHHFRTLGVDVQQDPFTMMGIGDMSGDVFGNGALRSRTVRLVGAFNHAHIFLDPTPDPEASFRERERMFALPRSTWRDYSTSVISRGGGIFDRAAKSIPLSPEVRALLDLQQESASGEEVIRAMLRAPVDLLYNGGIGTYVKASDEEDVEVGDRANDRVRVNGADLRARAVAEGGNLGFTQRARLEYWARGGHVNTDAVDNSAGVDMSDHEVNIKILLDLLVRSGVIGGRAERNRFLAEMTDNVSALVLADNAHQSLALTLDGLRTARRYDASAEFIESLVSARVLSRADDAVPTRDALLGSVAKGRGLPRPLLCVVLGHVKNWAFARALTSTLPDAEVARPLLEAYFPAQMRERYAEHFGLHPLRREIIATAAVNHVVNHAGVAFVHRATAATGAEVGDVIEAYLLADRESGAADARAHVLESTMPVMKAFEELVSIEDALDATVIALLKKEHVDLPAALNGRMAREP